MKLLDSGTSIGANIEEGRAGQSKPDFIAKNFISLKDSRETRFWLRLIGATDPSLQKELTPFLQEANEFIAIPDDIVETRPPLTVTRYAESAMVSGRVQ